jgi:hypothetical protein
MIRIILIHAAAAAELSDQGLFIMQTKSNKPDRKDDHRPNEEGTRPPKSIHA